MSQIGLTGRDCSLVSVNKNGEEFLSYNIWSPEALVYIAFLFYVLGFLFRDELWMRGLLLAGTAFYVLYYYFAPVNPLWDAILTSSIMGVVNVAMIIVVVAERTTFTMSEDKAAIYAHFANLSPGQFRRVIKRGDTRVADRTERLCTAGDHLDALCFIVHGDAEITKRGETITVPPGRFVGEVAFLRGTPASATVDVPKGAIYVKWDHRKLRALMKKSPNIHNAMVARFNLDLADKVATSQPIREELGL